MKKNVSFTIVLLFSLFSSAQVGINTTTPNAALEVNSNDSGILIPRVTLLSTLDATTVINPSGNPLTESTLIYNTVTNSTGTTTVTPGYYYWNGSKWVKLALDGNYWSTTGNSGINMNTNFIGTTDGNSLMFRTNNTNRIRITPAGYVGIGNGTINPTELLHVNGTVRISDGTEGNNKVLTSNANGVASWQSTSITNVTGILGSGVNIYYSYTGSTNWRYTNSRIILPPGKWAVNVTMLMAPHTTGSPWVTPDNSFFWLRSTFSNSATTLAPSSDIILPNIYVSGNLAGHSRFAILTGTIIINNTSSTNKVYYYIAGYVESDNISTYCGYFGGSVWGENSIIAYKIN